MPATVTRLSIAPVRSLGLQHPEHIDLTPTGVLEDRRFFVMDDTGRLIDRLVIGALVQIASETDPDGTWLRLTFPDGQVVEGEVSLGRHVEVPIHSRTGVGKVLDGPWGPALSAWAGRTLHVVRCDRPGGTRVANAVSLIGDGSLRQLAEHAGVEAVDGRRFRMLIELTGTAPLEEDEWIGGEIVLGDAVLRITKPDARCAITTQHPDTGTRDLDTLRTIISYRGLREGKHADLGVLGEVSVPGRVGLGDTVTQLG